MDDKKLAERFVASLRAGNPPWRFPHNLAPDFEPLFGRFYGGEPRSVANADFSVVDEIIGAVGVKVRHHWNCRRPQFNRGRDSIVLPIKADFQDERQYQTTRLHEVFHALEQSHRLNLELRGHQAELVAEAGAGMLMSFLRLPHDTDNTHVLRWVAWWALEIAIDPDYLYESLAMAEEGVEYILNLLRRRAAA